VALISDKRYLKGTSVGSAFECLLLAALMKAISTNTIQVSIDTDIILHGLIPFSNPLHVNMHT